MKKIFFLVISVLIAVGCGKSSSSFIKGEVSDFDVNSTAKRFSQALEGKNYHLVSKVDQEKIAKSIKEYLRPTITIEINNPKISTKLISCNPSMALELPIRFAIYRELNGKVHLIYTNPEYWSLKHNIKDKECIDLILLLARDFDIALDSIKKIKKVKK
jgi:uncharacterized protein (DUF302 family)